MLIMNYKKLAANIILRRRRKKNPSETHRPSTIDGSPPPKSVYQDSFNPIEKGCTTISKEDAHATRAMTHKANQTKYYKMNISCLYLSN